MLLYWSQKFLHDITYTTVSLGCDKFVRRFDNFHSAVSMDIVITTHTCNYTDDTRTTVVRHSRECLMTVVRHSCVQLTIDVRHLRKCLTTVVLFMSQSITFVWHIFSMVQIAETITTVVRHSRSRLCVHLTTVVRHSRECLTTFVQVLFSPN